MVIFHMFILHKLWIKILQLVLIMFNTRKCFNTCARILGFKATEDCHFRFSFNQQTPVQLESGFVSSATQQTLQSDICFGGNDVNYHTIQLHLSLQESYTSVILWNPQPVSLKNELWHQGSFKVLFKISCLVISLFVRTGYTKSRRLIGVLDKMWH